MSSGRLPDVSAFAPNEFLSRAAALIGFRDQHYRRMAVDALRLAAGDRVLELGCGTGANFALLEHAVGPTGSIVAVDASAAVLARARERARRLGWSNVDFVLDDLAFCDLPAGLDGVLATYVLSVVPAYDLVVQRAVDALTAGGRIVVLDEKLPSGPAAHLGPLIDRLSWRVPYSRIVTQARVWESMQRHSGSVRLRELYFGFVYLAEAEKE